MASGPWAEGHPDQSVLSRVVNDRQVQFRFTVERELLVETSVRVLAALLGCPEEVVEQLGVGERPMVEVGDLTFRVLEQRAKVETEMFEHLSIDVL